MTVLLVRMFAPTKLSASELCALPLLCPAVEP